MWPGWSGCARKAGQVKRGPDRPTRVPATRWAWRDDERTADLARASLGHGDRLIPTVSHAVRRRRHDGATHR